MENEEFLQAQQAQLTDMTRPYQREVNRRQRIADFVNRCIRSAGRDDFFQLYELLNSRMATEVETETGYEGVREVFERLREDAVRKVERYQIQFMEDFTRLVQDAGLPLENNFPRLRLLKGIDLEVNFGEKRTLVNGKPLKTVDPERIMRAVTQLKRRLYDRPFDPQGFIDGLFAACAKVNQAEGRPDSDPAPSQTVYLEFTLSLQPRSFFQDMAKGRFREYDADQFSVDFWRYFTSDVSSTSDGHVLRLNTGRGTALWLIDQTGEKRRTTSLSFQRNEDKS
jgi:hypothetical protein